MFLQLCFFKKALNSLEEVEPHVQMVTESQHIDYHFSGLEDDDGDDEIEYNEEDGSEVHKDGELSFEHGVNDKDQDADSSPGGSSEVMVSYVYGSDDIYCFPFFVLLMIVNRIVILHVTMLLLKVTNMRDIINVVDKLEMLFIGSILKSYTNKKVISLHEPFFLGLLPGRDDEYHLYHLE